MGLHFSADSLGLSSFNFCSVRFCRLKLFYFCKSHVSTIQGHSRSLILVPIESAARMRIRNSPSVALVLSCTVSEIFQVFVLLTPPLFHRIFGVFPLDQIADVGVHVSRYLKLFGREIIFEVFQPVWKHTWTSQTDRHTDDVLWHNRALRIASRGKNAALVGTWATATIVDESSLLTPSLFSDKWYCGRRLDVCSAVGRTCGCMQSARYQLSDRPYYVILQLQVAHAAQALTADNGN